MRKAKRDYKAEQAKTREALEPKVAKGYQYNPLPNRRTRRLQARAKNREAWGEANRQWSSMNRQTVSTKTKRTSLKDAKIEYPGGPDGREETN